MLLQDAKDLLGHSINGWDVVDKLVKTATDTGGFFSVGYIVQRSGIKAFLKALDFSYALSQPDPAAVLQVMTSAFNAERGILEACNGKNMKYVVRILESGTYNSINYMIFEMADYTAHRLIDVSMSFDYAWSLRSLHNIATGVHELHTMQVAHQDVKPSNVLMFNHNKISKIGDVGRASKMNAPIEHDSFDWAGDLGYSPFEQRYGYIVPDWTTRRFSCDMFMFGNLIYTYFNNISIVQSIFNKLPPSIQNATNQYKDVLPQLQYAFNEVLEEFNTNIPDENLRKELVNLVRKLSNPDIDLRGEPNTKGPERFSLYKTISRLDFLSKNYEYKLRRLIANE